MALPSEDIFLFVNPSSGGNKGQDFMKVTVPFRVQLEDGRVVALHIYSLPDKESSQAGFRFLKHVTSTNGGRPVRIIVGGGDGTVMWADSEASKAGIDTPNHLVYGIIPLGTGNDFSRVAGWGGKNPSGILNDDCLVLRAMVQDWMKATERPHDVWQVNIEVDDMDGEILKVSKSASGAVEKDVGSKSLTCPMINYFSVGQESKVGVEFDKHRTKSQTCNLFVYACQGVFTEMDCKAQQHVSDLVSSLHQGSDSDGKVLFGYDERHEMPELEGNPESLMFLNVNSYAGGAGQFWQIDSKVAVDPDPADEDINVQSNPGDGRLEVVTLPNIVNIALDRVTHEARRLHSGGPYYMEYFQAPDSAPYLDVYCEVDGEFYHLKNPVSTNVTFQKRLKVLQKVPDEDGLEWADYLSPQVLADRAEKAARLAASQAKSAAEQAAALSKQAAEQAAALSKQAADQAALLSRQAAEAAAFQVGSISFAMASQVQGVGQHVQAVSRKVGNKFLEVGQAAQAHLPG